ncbi:MAG: hypothetical protein O3C57_02960 [Verrucomicrobia bacterium]|nr:hypothetical protein [Verrucomicrobiota bacterium]
MNGLGSMGEIVKQYYDKVIAILAFSILVGAVVFVGYKMATMDQLSHAHDKTLSQIAKPHPNAAKIDALTYIAALADLNAPEQIPAYSNRTFNPEKRVWCIECRQPISFEVDLCPFCGTRQPTPPPPPEDYDKDGMNDAWELRYGLDPKDPSDADKDLDGDSFSNLEEFESAKLTGQETDPGNAEDYPPIAVKLCIEGVNAKPFALLFKSASKSGAEGEYVYQINTRRGGRTYFKKKGEYIDDFRIVDFKPDFVDVVIDGIRRQDEVSVLTLQKGAEKINLTMGSERDYTEYLITIRFTNDGSTSIVRQPGDVFQVLDRKYQVKSIDTEIRKIVIRGVINGDIDMEISGACK